MKSFPRQTRSCGGGIATVCKSTLGSNITFKTNFDFTHFSILIDWVIVRPDDYIHKKSTVADSLESDHYCTKSYFNVSVSKPSTLYRTVRNIANIDRPSFIAELSSVSEFSSVENANQFCDFLHTVIDKHAPPSLWKVITHKSSHWFESIRDELFIAKRERRQAERKWRNTKLTIFKDLYRQAKHKVSKLVHTAKCKSELLHSMQSCISNVKAWATANMLKLNDNKTELMLVTSKRIKHLHNLPTSITIGNAQVPFKQSLKNLGFTLDCHLTMNAYFTNIARTCYFELRRLASGIWYGREEMEEHKVNYFQGLVQTGKAQGFKTCAHSQV